MKTSLLTAVLAIMNLFASCQSPDVAEQVMVKLSSVYNKNDYAQIYAMLSPQFRAQASEAQITEFFRDNLKQSMGNIVSWKLDAHVAGAFSYTVHMVNGDLDLSLVLDDKQAIAGMQWLPAKKKKATKKRDASRLKSDNPMQTSLQKELDSLVRDFLQNDISCGISVGLIKEGRMQAYYYGSTNKRTDILPDSSTLYEIGSVSKTFTAIVLAHAINEGKIKPDDDVRKYLPGKYPELEYQGIPVRIKDLSNHTSGLPRLPDDFDKAAGYDPQDPYKHYTREMMYAYLKTLRLTKAPGTVSEYSNYGMGLLGLILEGVYGRPLEQLVTQYVTVPAGMKHTKFDLQQGEMQQMAKGYSEDGSEAQAWNLGPFNAAGGLKSDMQDMLQYLKANMEEINADFRLSHQPTYKDEHESIGLNWIISANKDHKTMIWHNGQTGGFSSFVGYIKDDNVGVVVLCNSSTDAGSIAVNLLRSMANGKR